MSGSVNLKNALFGGRSIGDGFKTSRPPGDEGFIYFAA